MTVTISVRNESCEAMPLAMGWHPYHAVAADIAPGDLRFDASARRDLDTQGRAQGPEIEPVFLMRRGETTAFEGWAGTLRLRAPCGGTIAIGAEGAGELVLHRPSAGDYLCAEPVSALPGHLACAFPLQPAETRVLSWTCGYEPAAFNE
jgi:aldose 1-epimerase